MRKTRLLRLFALLLVVSMAGFMPQEALAHITDFHISGSLNDESKGDLLDGKPSTKLYSSTLPEECEFHEFTADDYVEYVAPTCTTYGNEYYYECSICGHRYKDIDGIKEVWWDPAILILGHDFDADGHCKREGCGYSMPELAMGENDVDVPNPTIRYDWIEDQLNNIHYTLFKYVVTKDYDNITFDIKANDAIAATLYDSGMRLLDTNIEGSIGKEFLYTRNDVKAGDVFFIGVRGYFDNTVSACTIRVGVVLPACTGKHSLTLHQAVAPKCTIAGTKAYYECSVCLHRYSDAAGKVEINDVTDPALGHDIGEDTYCQREGCGYSNLLKSGNNAVYISNPTSFDEWTSDDDEGFYDPRHFTMFKFVAADNSDITIEGVGRKVTSATCYDANMDLWEFTSGVEDFVENFQLMMYKAKVGDVFYIGVRWWNDEDPADYIIKVTYDSGYVDIPNAIGGIETERDEHTSYNANRNAGTDKTYNVMGQRVDKNAKGLIIRNGRAILKK